MNEEKWMSVRPNLVNIKDRADIKFCIMNTEIDCYYNHPVFEYSVRLTTYGLLTKEHLKKIMEISDTYDLNVSIENINNRQNIVFS